MKGRKYYTRVTQLLYRCPDSINLKCKTGCPLEAPCLKIILKEVIYFPSPNLGAFISYQTCSFSRSEILRVF